jgi:polyphosphate kinase
MRSLWRTTKQTVNSKMKRKLYENELQKLQVELCYLQDWVKATGAQIIIIFEGHDAAGKGGTIKAFSERVSIRGLDSRGPNQHKHQSI